jgi:hypothetical protein
MSTDAPTIIASPVPVGTPLGIKELTAALVKHYDLHEGLYDLYLEYQFAFGNFGPSATQVVPSAVVGLSKLGVTKVSQTGPLTVDASEVNPVQPVLRQKRSSKSKSDA